MTSTEYDQIVHRMVEAVGQMTQSLGAGRALGQIFAYLYVSLEPRSLDDLTCALGISKGSASMCVRQLERWDALEKVWIRGSRKDYYRARDTFGQIMRNAIFDLVGKRIERSSMLLREVQSGTKQVKHGNNGLSAEDRFIDQRVAKIQQFHDKVQRIWKSETVKMLLK